MEFEILGYSTLKAPQESSVLQSSCPREEPVSQMNSNNDVLSDRHAHRRSL